MINQSHPLASWFLLLSAGFFLVAYAIPLTFFPLRWARFFRWNVPKEPCDLTLYFARCVGCVALAIIGIVVQAAADPQGHRIIFVLLSYVGGLMTALHIWGAIARQQPWTETVEIGLYAGLLFASLWINSTLG